ncbi:regulatory protein RecX [Microbacterium sp. ZW T5_56]|uniref:regulatory protein RecX n=1 Tax=Microbacterium sp. ZW T5_56 TaxID=3378081 RepID=UPI003853EF8B
MADADAARLSGEVTPGARDSTPTLMRASDLLKPDGERPRRPVALPTQRGWRDTGESEAAPTQDTARETASSGFPTRFDDSTDRAARSDVNGESGPAARPVQGFGARAGASRAERPTRAPRLRLLEAADTDGPEEATPEAPAAQRERAEAALLKKLRGKGLSVREARAFVIGLEVAPEIADDLIDEFLSLRYLDDAVLAEQLIYTASSRKGQGRRVIAQSLSARGIPREVIDAALEEVPDDDDERALDFARSKARSLAKLEPEVALRRLLGQLARRGFGGSSAMRAAKTALSEAGGSSVRFR